MFERLMLALIIVAAATGVKAQEEAGGWYVRAAELQCVVENISAYTSTKTEPVVIFLQSCPEVDALAALKEKSVNVATTEVATANDSELEPATVVAFTTEQLSCLSQLVDRSGQGEDIVFVPFDPCG
jgi:hypothetical protein